MNISSISGLVMPTSYAFQIAGATLLLLGSRNAYHDFKERQVKEAEDTETLNLTNCEGAMIGNDYTDPAKQEFTKALSFFCIVVGYILAVIAAPSALSRCCQIAIVLFVTLLLYGVNQVALHFVEIKFKKLYEKKPES